MVWYLHSLSFFFQAEDGIRDLVRSRGLGDVYKRQQMDDLGKLVTMDWVLQSEKWLSYTSYLADGDRERVRQVMVTQRNQLCLLYTSDAADDLLCVDLGGRRIIKKKKETKKKTRTTQKEQSKTERR